MMILINEVLPLSGKIKLQEDILREEEGKKD
jgi:hypothetical protein